MTNGKKNTASLRGAVLEYAKEHYGTDAEYLWAKAPDYAVLRHAHNRKWYAIIMDVPRDRLGLSGSGEVDILDVKCDPEAVRALRGEPGFLPAYHMNRSGWITALLDGTVEREMLFALLEESYALTSGKAPKKRRPVGKEWLIPANPKYYDLEAGFAESDIMLWKQSSSVAPGDTVFIYVGAPVSAIRYKCRVVETDLPYSYDDDNLHMRRVMKLALVHRFRDGEMDFHTLNAYGVHAVRGPRSVPNRLHYALAALCGEE